MKKCILLFFLLFPISSFAGQIYIEQLVDILDYRDTSVSIYADSVEAEISGFNFLLAIDETKYLILEVRPGQFLDSCNWEYFSWKRLSRDSLNFTISPATSLLEIKAVASLSGSQNPSCYNDQQKTELVNMVVRIPMKQPNVNNWCNRFLIFFFWRDCFDNILFTNNFDTANSVSQIYNFPYFQYNDSILISDSIPGFGIEGPHCDTVTETVIIPNLTAKNGFIELQCYEDGYYQGDINLNGKRFETADLVLYANYFMYGLSVFTVNEGGQISASDINSDGLTLNVADLYAMKKVVSGSTFGEYWKPITNPQVQADLEVISISMDKNQIFSLKSNKDIGAIHLKLTTEDNRILSHEDFAYLPASAQLGFIGDTTTILMMSFEDSPVFSAGENKLFESKDAEFSVIYYEAVDIYGRFVRKNVNSDLPSTFRLSQNFPNPFNPNTTISAYLPAYSEWTLSIFSITGQTIRTFNGVGQGAINIEWDGTDRDGNEAASGVYLYRMTADGKTDSRKMMLLK